MSVYHYAANNPVMFSDPLGDQTGGSEEVQPIFHGGYRRIGAGSGNNWADGINLGDWMPWGGSDAYRRGLTMGFTDIGGDLYGRGENGELLKMGYEYGQMVFFRPQGNPDFNYGSTNFHISTEPNEKGAEIYTGVEIKAGYVSNSQALANMMAQGLDPFSGARGGVLRNMVDNYVKYANWGTDNPMQMAVYNAAMFYATGEIGGALLSRAWNLGKSYYLSRAANSGSSTIYRAVSQAEAADIAKFGFRMKPGGYESGKLFAPTLQEATQFGKYNFGLDGIPNFIMEIKVPNSVLNSATKFGADGMNAISIPANQLNLLRGTPLNYSQWLR